jgi:hypothetical protein
MCVRDLRLARHAVSDERVLRKDPVPRVCEKGLQPGRMHSALGYLPPAGFQVQLKAQNMKAGQLLPAIFHVADLDEVDLGIPSVGRPVPLEILQEARSVSGKTVAVEVFEETRSRGQCQRGSACAPRVGCRAPDDLFFLLTCPETKEIGAGAYVRRRCRSWFPPRCGEFRSLC